MRQLELILEEIKKSSIGYLEHVSQVQWQGSQIFLTEKEKSLEKSEIVNPGTHSSYCFYRYEN